MSLTKIKKTKKTEKCILCRSSYNVYHLTIGEEFGRELFSQPICYSCLCLIEMDLCKEIKAIALDRRNQGEMKERGTL